MKVRSGSVTRILNPGSPSSAAPNIRSGLMNTSSKRTPRSSGRIACLRFGVMKKSGAGSDPAKTPPDPHPHQRIAVAYAAAPSGASSEPTTSASQNRLSTRSCTRPW